MFLRVGRFHVNLRAPALLPLILAVLAPLAPAQVQSVVKLMASPNPVVLGQPVTFTAGVNWTAAASPTGTITLIDTVVCAGSTTPTLATLGSITLGSSTSSAPGSGVLSVNSFPCAGRNQVLATYGGDANYLPGAALPVVATVLTTFTPTSTTIVSSLNPSTVGQNVSFTALLSYGPPNSTRPSGTVTFIDTTSNTVVGTGAV